MTSRFRTIPACRHIAPATTARPRRVVEDPATGLARADLDAIRMPVGQFRHERIGQPRERIVDRVADVAVIDADTVGCRDELDYLPGMKRPIDGVERAGMGRSTVGDRQGDLAQRRPEGADAREVPRHEGVLRRRLGADAVRALEVDHASIDEPRQRGVECRELLERGAVRRRFGVQEVEGVREIDVVRVTSIDRFQGVYVHVYNHSRPLDRLHTRRYIGPVT